MVGVNWRLRQQFFSKKDLRGSASCAIIIMDAGDWPRANNQPERARRPKMYEIKKIDVNSYYKDSDGKFHAVYEKTLSTARTGRELMAKENSWWFAGKGADIFRNGEKIGHTDDLISASANRQDIYTGRQHEVRLQDFLAAANAE